MACYPMRPAINNVFSQVVERMHREAMYTNAGPLQAPVPGYPEQLL